MMTTEITIQGVNSVPLAPNIDGRGSLTEIFRRSWDVSADPVQWNLLVSNAGVLRGMKVHVVHTDVVILLSGKTVMGLRDFRAQSTSFRKAEMIEMKPGTTAYIIPAGVGHAFYSSEVSVMLIGVSAYWDLDDELGCRWDDPKLGLSWPDRSPEVSDNDRAAPTVEALERQLATHTFC